ncbi:MAG: hypothetical protein H5T74_13675 [Actinobacteria bacterium]|nr:hypothetical protein [Actinomycetota bacterium]MDI6831515.1 hypothetical protein [Actinomycetota bacterium]
MGLRKGIIRGLGLLYRMLYRLPVVGDGAVRGMGRLIAFAGHHSPYGMKDGGSVAALRRDLEKALVAMDIDFLELKEGGERLDLVLARCPYGFHRPEHVGVCDAAMEQDRAMLAYVGARLVIEESIPAGSPACRVCIYPGGSPGRGPDRR